MFIRATKTKNKKTNTEYITHKLVESYRTEKGVRQRVILSLGKLDLPKNRWSELADILEARLNGQLSFVEKDSKIASIADDILKHHEFIAKKETENAKKIENIEYQTIDINSVSTSFSRSLGPELVANKIWELLKFDEVLKECHFNDKQISIAKASILSRVINPQSELATWKWFENATSLVEMTPYNISNIGKDLFYEITDLIYENKDKIEKLLFNTETTIFNLDRNIFLYDLTNTYYEGSANNNDKAKFGRSKEKRSDCKIISLALIVDNLGFPIFSQIYEGNVSEPRTLEEILDKLEYDTKIIMDGKKPVLIMDRGIATADNIKLMESRQYDYTVINRRATQKDYIEEFENIKAFIDNKIDTIPEGWEEIGENKVYIKKINHPEENKNDQLLSVSVGRTAKEKSMNELKEKRFNEDMTKLKTSFTKGNIKSAIKISERIGKIKAKYPSANKYYNIELIIAEDEKKALDIVWSKKESKKESTILTGCYVIETTKTGLTAKEIWNEYMTLNRVENSFRELKSELGLRPIYHSSEKRSAAHLFIGVLAYHILNIIEQMLKSQGDNRSWKSIKEILSTHQRSVIIMKNKEEKTIYLKISGTPEPEHNKIYRALKVKNPLKKICIIK